MVSEILLRLLWSLAATTAITVTPFGLAQEVTGETKSGASGIDTPADARDDSGERIPDEITVIPKSEAGSSATSQKQDEPPAGNPRTVAPAVESGIASVYASELEGNLTASGERYDSQKLTAAHRTLPFGSRIRVVDPAAGKTVSVIVNDRWAGGQGQIVNLSRRAADVLGMQSVGQRKVEIEVEALGDGRRQKAPQAGALTPQSLPARMETTSNNLSGRALSCANEADILGLRDVLLEIHVRNCLGRKSKSATTAGQTGLR